MDELNLWILGLDRVISSASRDPNDQLMLNLQQYQANGITHNWTELFLDNEFYNSLPHHLRMEVTII